MACRRPGDKPLFEPVMVRLLTHIRHSASMSRDRRRRIRVIQCDFWFWYKPTNFNTDSLRSKCICVVHRDGYPEIYNSTAPSTTTTLTMMLPRLILGLHPANERRRYKVTPSLIGWAQTKNQPWCCTCFPWGVFGYQQFQSSVSWSYDVI